MSEKIRSVKIRIKEPLRRLLAADAEARNMTLHDIIVERLTRALLPASTVEETRI
jgi:hypothetical protein